jgi:hypothetical protein
MEAEQAKLMFTCGALGLGLLVVAACSGVKGRVPVRICAALGLCAGFGAKEVLAAYTPDLSSYLQVSGIATGVAIVAVVLLTNPAAVFVCLNENRTARMEAQLKALVTMSCGLTLAYLWDSTARLALDSNIEGYEGMQKIGIHLAVAAVYTIFATLVLNLLLVLHGKMQGRRYVATSMDVLLPFCEIFIGFSLGWMWNIMVAESFQATLESNQLYFWGYTLALSLAFPVLIMFMNNRQNTYRTPKMQTLAKLQLQLCTNSCAMLLGWAWYGSTMGLFLYEVLGEEDMQSYTYYHPDIGFDVRWKHTTVLVLVYALAIGVLVKNASALGQSMRYSQMLP